MLKHLTIGLDRTDPSTWERVEVEDVATYLAERFKHLEHLPVGARIYHEHVADSCEITPVDEAGIARLRELPGPFYVMVFPGTPAIGANIVFGLFLFAASSILAPKPPPTPAQRNQSPPSPNNELADRVNRARPNGRIPDIYGTARSTPDLMGAPYKIFENNSEVEHSYMCIGRGYFDVSDVRDGDTLCVNIPGTTVQVFEPFTSPNSGDEPQLLIGTRRKIPLMRTERNNSVSGQVLRPPNETTFEGAGDIRFRYPNIIELPDGSPRDFTKHFVSGDVIDVTGASVTSGVTVKETLRCNATFVELRQKYGLQTYAYDTAGGSLLIVRGDDDPLTDTALALGLFAPGSTIVLDQVQGSNRFPGLDLSGTYVVDTAEYNVRPNDAFAGAVPVFFIVKLVNPEGVNSDWEDLKNGGDSWDWLREAGAFVFDISHPGADVDYSIDLNGTYNVVSVSQRMLVLDNPVGENAEWDDLPSKATGATPYLSADLASDGTGRWVGPFVMTDSEMEQVLCNFVAQNGLYKDDGTAQEAASIQIEVEVTPVDASDEPTGNPELFTETLIGSDELKETLAVTLKARFSSFGGRCAVRARRVTPHDEEFEGQVVDEVRWRDLYSCAFINQADFGNITTVQTVTYATASALAVKERKLNMLVTRKLPVYNSDGTFDDENLVATDNAADILSAICRDRYFGNRRMQECDFQNFYDTVAAVVEYFGHENAGKFCYTFDQRAVSFEEAVTLVASSIFCEPYRRGNIIRLSFEKQTDDSTLLFNHRNKVPGTEKRTQSFGPTGDFDGIEYLYVNPDDDLPISIFLPEGYAAINPKKIESIGVRNHLQAYFHAWREWNKLKHQNLAVEFEATSEAELLLRNDRILVADNTRPGTQDGEVVAVDGLELELTQPLDLTGLTGPVMHLQHDDGSTESIGISAGSDPNKAVLDDAPALPLVTDPEGFAKTRYVLTWDSDPRQTAFLFVERDPLTKLTSKVQAVNYDDRYYGNDKDYINEVIGENGYGPGGGFTPAEPGVYNPGPGSGGGGEWNPPGAPGSTQWSWLNFSGDYESLFAGVPHTLTMYGTYSGTWTVVLEDINGTYRGYYRTEGTSTVVKGSITPQSGFMQAVYELAVSNNNFSISCDRSLPQGAFTSIEIGSAVLDSASASYSGDDPL